MNHRQFQIILFTDSLKDLLFKIKNFCIRRVHLKSVYYPGFEEPLK